MAVFQSPPKMLMASAAGDRLVRRGPPFPTAATGSGGQPVGTADGVPLMI